MQIQRHRPFGRLVGRRVYTLPLEQINPLVRIAHRVARPLNLAERIIFDHELVLIVVVWAYCGRPREISLLDPGRCCSSARFGRTRFYRGTPGANTWRFTSTSRPACPAIAPTRSDETAMKCACPAG